MAAEDRTPTDRDWHTEELPDTPQRDFLIPSSRWIEAPEWLHQSGAEFGVELVAYKRRIGGFLLWRAGPAVGADARYTAIRASDLKEHYEFRLYPDKADARGVGPDGVEHHKFRSWKVSLGASRSGGESD